MLAVLAVGGWLYFRDPAATWRGMPAAREPVQTDKDLPRPFLHGDYTITPLARYHVSAVVVSRDRYRNDRGADLSPVDLALGWHTAEVRQVNVNGGNMAMAVAWQAPPPPGARGDAPYTTLPSAIIAPAARATAGPLEKVGAAFTPDVLLVAEAEGFVPPGGYVQRYSFEVQYPTTLKPTITWDFGDGQTIAGAKNRRAT